MLELKFETMNIDGMANVSGERQKFTSSRVGFFTLLNHGESLWRRTVAELAFSPREGLRGPKQFGKKCQLPKNYR